MVAERTLECVWGAAAHQLDAARAGPMHTLFNYNLSVTLSRLVGFCLPPGRHCSAHVHCARVSSSV